MAVVEWRKENSVAVVEMCNGPNRMNRIFAEDLNHCLDAVIKDTDIQAMVLTSTDEKNFSQGIDVEWLGGKLQAQENQAVISFMHGMNDIFKRLLLFPVPVIAAINGHAYGNGAIISCACDFRFMRKDRGFFCFPEVDVSIPFLPGMISFVRKAIPEYLFNQMLLSGQRMAAPDLETAKVIIKACEKDLLMTDAITFAGSFAKKREIFQELKKRMHKECVQIINEEDAEYIDSLNLFVA
ncbi:MAG: enoyl-CoA hydratase/isomerase family protein [Desulfobacula sp.]|nr:enoyl-CoA hydratase/isomerase family protein [Desulfobacula sp.]